MPRHGLKYLESLFLTCSHLAHFRDTLGFSSALHLQLQCIEPTNTYGNYMILELLKVLKPTEAELQTEAEIGRQNVMNFP